MIRGESDMSSVEASIEKFQRQKMEEIYFSLEKIKRDIYPLFCKLVEDPESVDFDVDALLEEFSSEPAFNQSNYEYLRDKSSVSNFFTHDVSTFGVILVSAIMLVGYGQREMAIKAIVDKFPVYVSLMEDIMSRALESDPNFVIEKKPLDFDFLKKSLISLIVDSEACGGRVKHLITKQFFSIDDSSSFSTDKFKSMLREKLDFKKFLSSDEEIITSQGGVTNSVFNIIRNACKKDFKANNVNFVVSREGDEMVIRVCDDGIGMEGKQLDEKGENFIFSHGAQSSTEAHAIQKQSDGKEVQVHGLGLSDMPERLQKNSNGQIVVWSRRKEDVDKPYSVFPNDCQRELPEKFIPIDADSSHQVPVSTEFEIRLPITKKAA